MKQQNSNTASSCLQLVGIIFLITQTLLMGGSFLKTLFYSLYIFFLDIIVFTFEIVLNNPLTLVFWIVTFNIIKNPKNVISISVYLFGKYFQLFKCAICDSNQCQQFPEGCEHSFHKTCLLEKYGQENIINCPICNPKKLIKAMYSNTFINKVVKLYQNNKRFGNIFLGVFGLAGLCVYINRLQIS